MGKKKLAILIAAIFTAALVLTGCGIAQRGQTQSDGQQAGQEEAAASAAAEAERKAEEAKQEAQKRAQEAREAREAESRASEDASEEANSSEGSGEGSGRQEEVTLEMEGEPETEFSGSCAVGGREGESVAGRVPRTFEYQTDGRKLKCEIRNESGGELKVVLVSGNDRSVQSIDARGATMELTYSDNALSSTTSSSSSGGGGSGSSQSVSSSSSSQSSHQSGGGSSHQSSSQSSRQVVSSE
jgi:hypothetical protein